ncbi:hypothetical protein GQ457_08G035710 [Hibiscus cannabinus]
MSFKVFRTNYAYLFDQELERIIEESKEEQAQRRIRNQGIVIKDQIFGLCILVSAFDSDNVRVFPLGGRHTLNH